jgi:steroid delta-isomerase-like uncharacterized protein
MAQQTTTSQGPVDREWLEGFLEKWEAAWDTHDPDQVLALMTDDVVYEDSGWPKAMRGHAEVREFLEYVWTGMPDTHFEAIDGPYLHPDEPKVSFYWRGTGTNTGRIDPPGIAPTGKAVEFYGADFHEYRDGKVANLKIVFDMADLMREFGVLPPPGSREERMMSKVANMRAKLPGGG